jgi:hypothetical protein
MSTQFYIEYNTDGGKRTCRTCKLGIGEKDIGFGSQVSFLGDDNGVSMQGSMVRTPNSLSLSLSLSLCMCVWMCVLGTSVTCTRLVHMLHTHIYTQRWYHHRCVSKAILGELQGIDFMEEIKVSGVYVCVCDVYDLVYTPSTHIHTLTHTLSHRTACPRCPGTRV